jgi:predicted phage terminase large subunit-like protein
MMTRGEKEAYFSALQERLIRESRTDLLRFTLSTMPTFRPADFQQRYYSKLTEFAHGKIKKLMVFMPPQHGKSEGSTRRLPPFILGINPDTKVALISYNAPKARKFNREIQRVIDTPEYRSIFPHTRLNTSNIITVAGQWLRNADECEIVGYRGGFKTVGVCGSITGEPVDVLIMDDIYKDAKTAWSPVVREAVSDWYDTTAETRLHNDSQQLIVFTRWHEDDLAGTLLRQQGVYDPAENPSGWVVLVYRAIKEGAPTEYDPREEGEALWAERHSLDKLQSVRSRNPHVFESLYQQDPKPSEGLMYENGFAEYAIRPATQYCIRKAYVDTADTGGDYLCAIIYDETETGNYIVDVMYTQKPMEYTEPGLARLLTRHAVAECTVESNNGGRSFQRAVEQQCRLMENMKTRFRWFHQTENKDIRIYSNSAAVQNLTFMPQGWKLLFPEFASAICGYMKVGKNPHDDAPDALTATVEKRRKRAKQDVAGLLGY